MLRTWLASIMAFGLILALAPGLGGGSGTAEASPQPTTVSIHLLLDQGGLGPFLVPVEREVGDTTAVARAAVTALLEGPTDDEAASLPAVSTSIPDDVVLRGLSIDDGLATVDLSADFAAGGGSFTMLARVAQLTYTVTQFPTVDGLAIELDGEPITVFSAEGLDVTPPVTRAAFDGAGVLPPVFVETPRYGGDFEARLTGTSSTETFAAQILDGDGRLLGGRDVTVDVTAERAAFDVSVPYISLTEQFGIVLVEDEADRTASLREYPVTLAKTPIPTARDIAAACPPGQVPDAGFADVADANTHADAIDCIAWRGVTLGRTATTYAPATAITRGQMASMLARTLQTTDTPLPPDPASSFSDVAGTTHALAIDQLAELGIVQGRTDGTYGPNIPVNRAQMTSFLMRTFTHVTEFEPEPDRSYFTDTAGSVHRPAIDAAALTGVTEGVDADRFVPGAQLRRDQMASFVARLLDLLVVEGGVTLTE
jgi:hypothetical protein